MAYSNFRNGFLIQTASAIDKRIYLTKAEMLRESSDATSEYMLPEAYLAICPDDGKLYIYNEANELNAETGKFKCIDATLTFETPEAKAQFESAINNSPRVQEIETTLGDAQERTGVFAEIDEAEQKIEATEQKINEVETTVIEVIEPKVTALETKVGDNTSGLIKVVNELTADVDNFEPRIRQAEEDLVQAEEDIEDIQTWINNVRLDGGEIKAIYTLSTYLTGVKLDSEDRSIEYKTEKIFEFDVLPGFKLPNTITVNTINSVGAIDTDCGTTVASWIVSKYDDDKPYGKLTLKNTTNNVTTTIVAEAI